MLVACKVDAGIHIAVPGPTMYKRLSASTVIIPDIRSAGLWYGNEARTERLKTGADWIQS
jgi:hypothetical protein